MSFAIKAEGVGKKYLLGHQAERPGQVTLREVISRHAGAFVGRLRHPFLSATDGPVEELWALRDVSFEVKPSERLGIIGRNGAGKSTLLKILSRITEPSSGRITIRGRVASLLEVGTGFHAELTGRENIFLNGAILGMRRTDIRARFDEIVAFSELDRFLDTPVKRYSSGMYVRLAFAVAAHLEPDILIVDEVLAVGDAAFQRKCLGKMDDVSGEGRTVLFVSHHLDLIRSLCGRCLLLDGGRLTCEDVPNVTITRYLEQANASEPHAAFEVAPDPSLPMQITRGRILNKNGVCQSTFDVFEPVVVELGFIVNEAIPGGMVNFEVKKDGSTLFFTFDTDSRPQLLEARKPGTYCCRVEIPAPLFKPGHYAITPGTGIAHRRKIQHLEDALGFQVASLSVPSAFQSFAENRAGAIATRLDWYRS